jgi:superfamily I DNA/RNA helicase
LKSPYQNKSFDAEELKNLKASLVQEMKEERRNCFVAITRARQTATLSFADECFGWLKQPSRFLEEMGMI